jgi:hypothetical protein
MKGLNYWAIGLAAVTVVGMTGCGAKKDAEMGMESVKQEAAKTATDATNTVKAVGGAAAGSAAMMNVVKDAKTAIASGDFTKAGEAFEKFESSWNLVAPGLKAKNPKAHDAIVAGLGKVKSALKAKDAVQSKSAITALETSLALIK